MVVSALHLTSRVAASLLGAYGFLWGFSTLGMAVSVAIGFTYDAARLFFNLLAIFVLLVSCCWAFVERSVTRVWLVLAGGGAVMTGGAWLIVQVL